MTIKEKTALIREVSYNLNLHRRFRECSMLDANRLNAYCLAFVGYTDDLLRRKERYSQRDNALALRQMNKTLKDNFNHTGGVR